MTDRAGYLTELRERAQEAIARGEARLTDAWGSDAELEFHQLVEELRVYQAELELQNEELVEAQGRIALALEKYRLLFEHLPLPAFVIDPRGIIQEANDAACSLFALKRHLALQRASVVQLFDFPSRARLHQLLQEGADGPRSLEFLGVRLGPDEVLPCDVHLMPLATGTPPAGQAVLVLVDRSSELALRDSEQRWRQLSAELEVARREAESANAAKSAFLAAMSHEFRTPMNAVIGLTDLLLGDEPSPRQQDYLLMVRDAAETLSTLLNDILDYARIETGMLTLEHLPLRLDEVLAATRELYERRAADKQVRLHFSLAPDLPPQVIGDPLRLQQVINHLVGNAIKFTTHGTVRVRLERQRTPGQPGLLLRVTVSDTGIGMTAAEQERLFLPFRQGDMSDTRQYGGTGIGLCISKRLAELMGGEIGVHSVPGQGSTFWFTAWLDLPAAEEAATSAPAPVPAQTLLPRFNELAVLLARGDGKARQVSREIAVVLAETPLKAHWEEIGNSVAALDFPTALAQLRLLAAAQGWQLV